MENTSSTTPVATNHVLIVTAHPSSLGFTHKIAAAFKEGAESVGKTVEVVDLYKTDLQMGYMSYEEKSDMAKPNPVREKFQAKITAASEVVFVHPLWWMGTPAIMKNFLDTVLTPHFAYVYKNGWPVGLLKGKKGYVFITCDGRRWLYFLMAMPFWTNWTLATLKFCGFKSKVVTLFEKFKKTDVQLNAFLDKVKKYGAKK